MVDLLADYMVRSFKQRLEPDLQCVAHALPAMVFFFLFLFMLLFATFLLTIHVTLCKPGCAISTADTSSV